MSHVTRLFSSAAQTSTGRRGPRRRVRARTPPAARTSSACPRARSSRRGRTSPGRCPGQRRGSRAPASPAPAERSARNAPGGRRQQAFRNRLGQHGVERVAQQAAFCARSPDPRIASSGSRASAASTAAICRPTAGRRVRVEIGVGNGVGSDGLTQHFRVQLIVHLTTRNAGVGSATKCRRLLRARDSLDITVPTGIDSMPAISS